MFPYQTALNSKYPLSMPYFFLFFKQEMVSFYCMFMTLKDFQLAMLSDYLLYWGFHTVLLSQQYSSFVIILLNVWSAPKY